MKNPKMKWIAGALIFLTLAYPGAALAAPQETDDSVQANYYEYRGGNHSSQNYYNDYSFSVADRILATGQQFLGIPYKFGAESGRTDGFDCSSFTQYVFKAHGIDLPRSSRQQAKAGIYVPKSQLQKGDLIFSDTNRDGIINHVSIYMGNNQILHTYRVGIGVTISEFEGSTWDKTYVTARRVIS